MASEGMPHRVALYFAPDPDSAWWRAGSQWLGRCAHRGVPLEAPPVPGVPPAAQQALSAEPRRYGFHATLKPPFRLTPGSDLARLTAAVQRLAHTTRPFVLPRLRVAVLGDFLALRPESDSAALQALAARCVTELHPLAAPLTAEELARRRRQPLNAEQDAMLQRWGYPWVLQQFRFHFSLSGSLKALSEAQRAALQRAAEDLFHPLPELTMHSLSLFVEPQPGADFVWAERVGLGA